MSENAEDLRKELEQRSSEQLISILRNRDEEEWRPEVFDVVAAVLRGRGISPEEVMAMGPEGTDVVESAPTVTIGHFFSPAEAHLSRTALEAADIPAWVADEAGGTMWGVGIGARLQVRVKDEAAAREVLAAVPASSEGPPLAGPSQIPDPLFQEAVSAIDAGDLRTLERLLETDRGLITARADYGEGYFRNPYLLWFVAENPIRNGTLPANIVEVTRALVQAGERSGAAGFREQLDYTLGLVCSGRVARECGVQGPLIDLLVSAGANPDSALLSALAHREVAAAGKLLDRGATLTLPAAVCTGRTVDVARLLPAASAGDRQLALTAAALYGDAAALAQLVASGVDVTAYSPPGFHPHGTALHHAVDSGSLDAVKVLVEAGAPLETKDHIHQGTPLDWAEYLQKAGIAAYLRGAAADRAR